MELSPTDGKITDLEVDRSRTQVNVHKPAKLWTEHSVPAPSGLSYFAVSFGDDDALFWWPKA